MVPRWSRPLMMCVNCSIRGEHAEPQHYLLVEGRWFLLCG